MNIIDGNGFKYDPDHVFFTSDTHFGHANIIRFCKRPFENVEEMNEVLIENWNKVVSDDDTVFHLGDFAFGGFPYWEAIRLRLNGHINLILGNHCIHNVNRQNSERLGKMFDWVGEMLTIHINRRPIILSHYPLRCYPDGYWNLFGHIHSGPNSTSKDVLENVFKSTQYDVGVDNNNFTPISYKQIKLIIQLENGSVQQKISNRFFKEI